MACGFQKNRQTGKASAVLFVSRFCPSFLSHDFVPGVKTQVLIQNAAYFCVLRYRYEELNYVYDKSTKENTEQENKEKAVLATAPGESSRHIERDLSGI